MFTFSKHHAGLAETPARQRGTGDSPEIHQLRADVERLYFITEALWRILREKHALTDDDIVRQIAAIDLEDGRLDGKKATLPPKPCPTCGRILAKQRPRCIFCGDFVKADPFER